MEMPGEPDPKAAASPSRRSLIHSRCLHRRRRTRWRIWPTCSADTFPKSRRRSADFGGGNWGVKLDPKKMPEALKDGTVNEAAVTRAAGRVLYEIVHFGYMDGLSKHDVTAQAIEENAKIIERTGEDAAVLLKNEGGVLPLKAADLDSVVLIGPTAAQVDAIGINGERSVGLPERQVGPLAAMKQDLRQLRHRLCRG